MILDIVLFIILALGALIGYKKGLAKIVLKLVGFVLSLILAYIFCTPLSNYLYEDVGLGTKISSSIEESISGYISNKSEEIKEDVDKKVKEKVLDEKEGYISKIENLLTKSEIEELETEDVKAGAIKNISDRITMYILKAMAFIIILILVNICMLIITLIFDGITKLPIINTFNKTGGCIASVILTMLKIWIVLGIISLTEPLGLTTKVISIVEDSRVVSWLYDNNILMNIVLKSLTK